MSEPLLLSPRKGQAITAQATVRRTSHAVRLARVGALVAGGGALGLAAILVPPHGLWVVGTWVASGVAGWAVWNHREFIESISGKCSACEAEVTAREVGAWSNDLWIRCPACQAPYRVGRPSQNS